MNHTDPARRSPNTAIHELIDAYADQLYRFARRAGADDADAKDLVQEAFVRAFERWSEFRHEASPKTWLYQIVRNLIRDSHRRRRVRERYLEAFVPDAPKDDLGADILDVRQALTRLSLPHRQVICLRFIDDFSVEDTAQLLGWTQSKVRTTQHRALKRLHELLKNNDLHRPGAVWTGR